jgi:hypothetical protein
MTIDAILRVLINDNQREVSRLYIQKKTRSIASLQNGLKFHGIRPFELVAQFLDDLISGNYFTSQAGLA